MTIDELATKVDAETREAACGAVDVDSALAAVISAPRHARLRTVAAIVLVVVLAVGGVVMVQLTQGAGSTTQQLPAPAAPTHTPSPTPTPGLSPTPTDKHSRLVEVPG